MQITREQFISFIEAGIESARLRPKENEALREVGRTSTRCLVGDFGGIGDCGCPAVQAGLPLDENQRTLEFALAFDDAVRRASIYANELEIS